MVAREQDDLAPGMVRVAFGAGGICGSDLHYFRHGRSGDFTLSAPLVLGHEIAGKVMASAAPLSRLTLGQRVAINPARWCGHCAPCTHHRPNLCENIYFMGSASTTPHMQGGFASQFDVTPEQCVAIADHVSYRAAALAEPLAVCLHALSRVGEVKDKTVLVMGAGPIGLLVCLAARQAGAGQIMVCDIAAAPLEAAKRIGADHVSILAENQRNHPDWNAHFDVVFEASGTPSGLAASVEATKRGGVLVQIGNQPAGDIAFPANAVMAKEIDLHGSFRFGHEFTRAVDLISSGTVDVEPLITAELPLREALIAFGLAQDRTKSIKVMLTAGLH